MGAMQPRVLCAVAVAAVVLAGCGEGPAPGTAGSTGTHAGGDAGEPAAGLDFTVTTFEGETFRLSDHRGTPVVLNFWESW